MQSPSHTELDMVMQKVHTTYSLPLGARKIWGNAPQCKNNYKDVRVNFTNDPSTSDKIR